MGLVKLGETRAQEHAGGNRDVPRNRRGQPLVKIWVPSKLKRDNGKLVEKIVPYTRMTTWIDCLDDKTNLTKWKGRMALAGLTCVSDSTREWLLREIAEAFARGDKGKLNGIVERLQKEAGSEEKSAKGTWLHELSEYADKGLALPALASEEDVDDIAAYMLATIDLEIKRIEHFVVLDDWKVGGTPDRISFYAGPDPDGREPAGHLITDLKTGSIEYGGLKMAMQLAGYAHGKLYDPETGDRTAMPDDLNLKWGLIINAPAGTGTCKVEWIDLTLGWDGFQLAKEVRAMRNRGRKAFRPYPSMSDGLATIESDPDDDTDESE